MNLFSAASFVCLVAAQQVASAGTVAQKSHKPFVSSDYATLRKVLIHTPQSEIGKVTSLVALDHEMFPVDNLNVKQCIKQHRDFAKILSKGSLAPNDDVEVIQLVDVLNDAIAESKKRGTFRDFIATHYNGTNMLNRLDEVDAAALIGANDKFAYAVQSDGSIKPETKPQKWAFFTRDFAVMTPKGVMIMNFWNRDRALEPVLAEFAFTYANQLKDIPIILKGMEESIYLQGGDIIVVDKDTMFMGVGNVSQREAAIRIAQKIGIKVVAVDQIPNTPDDQFLDGQAYTNWIGAQTLFLHLDTVFNVLSEKKALALPYFLEAKYTDSNPLSSYLANAVRAPEDIETVNWLNGLIKDYGWVTVYQPITGEADPSVPEKAMKLLDYIRSKGYDVVYVGGDIPSKPTDQVKHLFETVMSELRFQGANSVAVGPDKVITYSENEETVKALKKASVEVQTFEGSELARWNGGPHCMTMPLLRD